MRCILFLAVAVLALAPGLAGTGRACTSDAECDDGDPCNGSEACEGGACGSAFTLPFFVVDASGDDAYSAPIISVMDHSGPFYQRCCDTEIVAFTGETATRGEAVELCPEEPVFPACLFNDFCLCGYRGPTGAPFVVNGSFEGALFDPTFLSYAGHAGYDFRYPAGTALVATRHGELCKAAEDPVNGFFPAASAWDRFHTFYIDHGVSGGFGYSSWYLHASDLDGVATDATPLADLEVGECAPVAAGQLVGRVGNQGTFLPHLHFEVRRHPAGESPESFAAKVIDPYGWRGSELDPWSDPNENPQATTRDLALWIGCGNGRLDCGELCDDGNRLAGDCCSPTCTPEPSGAACSAGGGLCADERCDGAGLCVDVAAPRDDCLVPTRPLASRLDLRDRFGGDHDRLVWRWLRGEATPPASFGDPTTSDGYRLCVFDLSAMPPRVVLGATAPAGGLCPGAGPGRPCWTARGSPPGDAGFLYVDRDLTPDGLLRADLSPGADGKARITLKGKGANLGMPALPLPVPLQVQLESSSGACWSARYSSSGILANDETRFRARGD